jgi:hypothetical protein
MENIHPRPSLLPPSLPPAATRRRPAVPLQAVRPGSGGRGAACACGAGLPTAAAPTLRPRHPFRSNPKSPLERSASARRLPRALLARDKSGPHGPPRCARSGSVPRRASCPLSTTGPSTQNAAPGRTLQPCRAAAPFVSTPWRRRAPRAPPLAQRTPRKTLRAVRRARVSRASRLLRPLLRALSSRAPATATDLRACGRPPAAARPPVARQLSLLAAAAALAAAHPPRNNSGVMTTQHTRSVAHTIRDRPLPRPRAQARARFAAARGRPRCGGRPAPRARACRQACMLPRPGGRAQICPPDWPLCWLGPHPTAPAPGPGLPNSVTSPGAAPRANLRWRSLPAHPILQPPRSRPPLRAPPAWRRAIGGGGRRRRRRPVFVIHRHIRGSPGLLCLLRALAPTPQRTVLQARRAPARRRAPRPSPPRAPTGITPPHLATSAGAGACPPPLAPPCAAGPRPRRGGAAAGAAGARRTAHKTTATATPGPPRPGCLLLFWPEDSAARPGRGARCAPARAPSGAARGGRRGRPPLPPSPRRRAAARCPTLQHLHSRAHRRDGAWLDTLAPRCGNFARGAVDSHLRNACNPSPSESWPTGRPLPRPWTPRRGFRGCHPCYLPAKHPQPPPRALRGQHPQPPAPRARAPALGLTCSRWPRPPHSTGAGPLPTAAPAGGGSLGFPAARSHAPARRARAPSALRVLVHSHPGQDAYPGANGPPASHCCASSLSPCAAHHPVAHCAKWRKACAPSNNAARPSAVRSLSCAPRRGRRPGGRRIRPPHQGLPLPPAAHPASRPCLPPSTRRPYLCPPPPARGSRLPGRAAPHGPAPRPGLRPTQRPPATQFAWPSTHPQEPRPPRARPAQRRLQPPPCPPGSRHRLSCVSAKGRVPTRAPRGPARATLRPRALARLSAPPGSSPAWPIPRLRGAQP